MKEKIYPRSQIKQYLIIDVIAIVSLLFIVLRTDTIFGLLGNMVLFLIFLFSFYIGLWYRDWRLLAASLLGLTVLTILGIYASSTILIFGFIFADLIGRSKSKVHIGIGIIAIGMMFSIYFWKGTGNLLRLENSILLPIMILQLVFPILIHIKERTKLLQGELDSANKQIEKFIQEEERQRIARDLHDTLGQTLTMIKLKSELTTRLIDKDTVRAKEELNDILGTSRIALKQVRELVSDMKFISLKSELENADKVMKSAGIEFEARIGDIPILSSVAETMIALSVRESFTNIIRHSNAERCTIALETIDGMFNIRIVDNGIGLKQAKRGNGIQSIVERMQSIQGTAIVSSLKLGGTEVVMKIPIHQQGKEKLIR